jgi:CDP-diacylglycerol--serine O-phosphatidyltransferase
VFLILAVVFDAIDGPLARRFPSSTKEVFGETMDSLADAISFGVAPAIIIYELFDTPLMIVASILLLCCGILRLSRYNTIITEQEGPTKTFIGLPIPVSSFMLSLLLFSQINQDSLILIIMSVIAVLMISSLKYPKIKNIKIFGVCGVLLILTLILPLNNMLMHIPSIILIFFVLGYIILPFTNIKL